MEVVIFSDLCL